MAEQINSEVPAFTNDKPVHDWLRQIITTHVEAVLSNPECCMSSVDDDVHTLPLHEGGLLDSP